MTKNAAPCAQTLYALRVLRAHGLHDSALQYIYRSVVLAKLLYASGSCNTCGFLERFISLYHALLCNYIDTNIT